MGRNEVRAVGARLVDEARALRAAFPEIDAMRGVPIAPLPPMGTDSDVADEYRTALGYLRDEMVLVRSGRAGTVCVLDDEIACVERLSR